MLLGASKGRTTKVIEISSMGLSDPEKKRSISSRKNNVSTVVRPEQSDDMWKVKWMDEYDTIKKKLAEEKQMFRKQIIQAKQWFKKKRDSLVAENKLLSAKIERQSVRTNRLKCKYRELKSKHEDKADSWSQTVDDKCDQFTQMECDQFTDASTQTCHDISNANGMGDNETTASRTPASSPIQDNGIEMTSLIETAASSSEPNRQFFLDHTYSKPSTDGNDASKAKSKEHTCDNCGYTTHHMHRFNVHCKNHCATEPVKDITCSICQKNYTRDGFRSHIRHFINGEHESRGKHANYSKQYHRRLLEQFKSSHSSK